MRFLAILAALVPFAVSSALAAPVASTVLGEQEVFVRNDFSDLAPRDAIEHLYARGLVASKNQGLPESHTRPSTPRPAPPPRPATPPSPHVPNEVEETFQRPSSADGGALHANIHSPAPASINKAWPWAGPKPPEPKLSS
ncbi:hypothetical protein EIP91_006138 [Steccherinum ochraceum]|uniref:Uncharacterized protein n=1 Tax=Steccherinum ochraceum TaxID=92696 RepID=A0A4R0RTP9_9APHY|nr:hypothetical protein EIP91_006138 [Steccherinum ochraceum]